MDVFQVANYKEYLFDTAKTIFGIDSPSGYYHAVVKEVEKIATGLGYKFEQIEKGCGIITIDGEDNRRLAVQSCQLSTVNTAASTPEMVVFTPVLSFPKARLFTFIRMLPPEPEMRTT